MARYLVGDAQTYSAKWDITFNVDIVFQNRNQGDRTGRSVWTIQANRSSALAYGGTGPHSFDIYAGEKTLVNDVSGKYPLIGTININDNRDVNGQIEARLHYKIQDNRPIGSSGVLSGYFVLETLPPPQGDRILGNIPIQTYRVSGTIKAKVYTAAPYLEYVDINEHYPLDGPYEYDNCGSEFYIPADLTEETVRQWPKYTTIDWFELLDTRKTAVCSMAIYAEFTSKKGIKTYGASKTYPAWPPRFNLESINSPYRPTYQLSRNIEAHASGDSSNSGSIYASYGGLELSGSQNKSISIPGVSCDTYSFSIIVDVFHCSLSISIRPS